MDFFHYYSRCVLPLLVWIHTYDYMPSATLRFLYILEYGCLLVCASTDEAEEAWILVCVILEEPC
jgi:hypothetical protein